MGIRYVMFLIPLLFGGIKNPDKAIGKLERTCADGRSAECSAVAERFLFDEELTSDTPRAVGILESICNTERKRDPCEWPIEIMACRRVGETYAMGHGVPRDIPRGRPFLERASDGGDTLASIQLGRVLEKTDEWKARERYALACGQTHFLGTGCGIADARVKAYQEYAAFGCERSTADWSVPSATSAIIINDDRSDGVAHVNGTGGRKIKNVPPQFPPAAMRMRHPGGAEVEATIDATGHVRDVQVISGTPGFIESVVEAVKQWVYTPYLVDGKPVAFVIRTSVNFGLY
jgi:TonB family protein